MSLLREIKSYNPINEQEQRDKALILDFMAKNANCLSRENLIAHFTASMWTVT